MSNKTTWIDCGNFKRWDAEQTRDDAQSLIVGRKVIEAKMLDHLGASGVLLVLDDGSRVLVHGFYDEGVTIRSDETPTLEGRR